MLKKLKLGTKFNLLLTLVFVGGIVLSGVTLSRVLEQRAQAEVTAKAELLIQTMNSVRDYTSEHIQPLLNPRLDIEPVFISETVPAFSATTVFQNLRSKEDYKDFFYKEATPNPTNLRDKADSFETAIVNRFRNEPNTKKISGFRDLSGGQLFYIALPLAITKESCLRCHSTPDIAPKSQLATYGTENGFGWKMNEIIAAQIVSVPTEEVVKNARQSLSMIMTILIGVFATIVLMMNFLLKRAVIQPIKQMAKTAEAISMGSMDTEFEHKSDDEIGALAAAFNRMKSSLEISMKLLNKRSR